jgi:hypothetical protein
MSNSRKAAVLRNGMLLISLSAAGLLAGACSLLLSKEALTCATNADCAKYPGTTCDLPSLECRAGSTGTDGSTGMDGDVPDADSGAPDVLVPFDGPDPCQNPNKPLKELKGDINTNLTLSCENDYLIVGRVAVVPPFTATISAGTTLYGDTRLDATTNSLGTLVVPPGSRIVATGTADKPVVFTSAKKLGPTYAPDGGTVGSGDWGGIFIFGEAPLNTPDGTSTKPSLAPWGSFGGNKPSNDSGRLEYVRIEYAGAKLPDGQDGTSLDLGGVGDQTTIDHVQVRFSANDCFEVLGGRVNLKHVLCQYPTDDGIAWENGWTGKVQFVVVQGRPGVDDTANGLQGRSGGATSVPVSEPAIYNGTFCGQNLVPVAYPPGTIQYGVRIDNFSRVHIFNSAFLGWQTTLDLRGANIAPDVAGDGGVPFTEFKSSVAFGNLSANANVAYPETQTTGGTSNPLFDDDNGFDEAAWWLNAANNNSEANPGIPKCFDAVAPRFGTPGPINAATAAIPPNDGFFDPTAKYVGAFKDQGDLWATGRWVVWDNK